MGYVKTVCSGNVLEIYEYEKSLAPRIYRKKKGSRGLAKSFARRRDNVERLKKAFVRLVLSNLGGTETPLFFTFTMVEVVRVERAYRLFTECISRLRRVYGKHFRYIAVPEFQKRGAVHFHALFWGFKEKTIENERMYRTIQNIWARGYVDCIYTDGSPKLAFYVAKYMQKALYDKRLLGQKSYCASRNVRRPIVLSSAQVLNYSSDIFGVDVDIAVPEKVRDFQTKWLGSCRYRKFVL